MKKLTTVVLTILTLAAIPQAAQAQTMEQLRAGWDSWDQIQREVWIDNPNAAQAVQHAIGIMQDHGLWMGRNVWGLNINSEPEGWQNGNCIEYLDENGNWQLWCSDNYAMRCYTRSQIDDLKAAKDQAWWASITFQVFAGVGAPIYPPAGAFFQGASIAFRYWEHRIGLQIERMEAAQCIQG